MGYNLWMKIPFTKGDICLCDMKRWCYINLFQGQGTRRRGRTASHYTGQTYVCMMCDKVFKKQEKFDETHLMITYVTQWTQAELTLYDESNLLLIKFWNEERAGYYPVRFQSASSIVMVGWYRQDARPRVSFRGQRLEKRGVQTHATFKLDNIPQISRAV